MRSDREQRYVKVQVIHRGGPLTLADYFRELRSKGSSGRIILELYLKTFTKQDSIENIFGRAFAKVEERKGDKVTQGRAAQGQGGDRQKSDQVGPCVCC